MAEYDSTGILALERDRPNLESNIIGAFGSEPRQLELRRHFLKLPITEAVIAADQNFEASQQARKQIDELSLQLSAVADGMERAQISESIRDKKNVCCIDRLAHESGAVCEMVLDHFNGQMTKFLTDIDTHLPALRAERFPTIEEGLWSAVVGEILNGRDLLKSSADFHLRLALDEIFRNHLMHGHVGDYRKVVVVRYGSATPDRYIVISQDEGSGFDLGAVRDPKQSENLEIPNGRGIFLARSFLDRVEYTPEFQGRRVVCEINFTNRLAKLAQKIIAPEPATESAI